MKFFPVLLQKFMSYILGEDILAILKGRWKRLVWLFIIFSIISISDYYIISNFSDLVNTIKDLEEIRLSAVPVSILILAGFILLRPIISWLLNAYCVYIAQKLLREVEECFPPPQRRVNTALSMPCLML